jgi:hypothetical protein
MKVLKTLSFAFAALFLFASCSKEEEGVYSPKKKISKVYYEWEDAPKELIETWTWNGDLLTKIEYGNDVLLFKYKNDRIDYITDEGNTGGMYFIYDGSEIDKIIINK